MVRKFWYPGMSRRDFLKASGLTLAAVACGQNGGPVTPPEEAEGAPEVEFLDPSTQISGDLSILLWSHFVPRHDEWFDAYAQQWGEQVGVNVTVDHIDVADVPARISSEISAGSGHDLMQYIAPIPQFEPSVVDMSDLVQEAEGRYGSQVELCRISSFNPTTNRFFAYSHSWVPDPGDYRKSLWEGVGLPNGPTTWQELLEGGAEIKANEGVQMGIGMTQEVFAWTAASNNELLIAGQASYILNSISAYRTAQQANPEVANDIFFSPALEGPSDDLVAQHVMFNWIVPEFSPNPDAAKEFLLNYTHNQARATFESELYDFPAFPERVPQLPDWLNNDPFGSDPPDKLSVLAE